MIKEIFRVQRPFNLDKSITPIRPETATGYSFPSGHTQSTASLCTAVAVAFRKKWITVAGTRTSDDVPQVEIAAQRYGTEWVKGWKARGWRTAAKQPVKNAELWQQLDALVASSGHKIDWRWVRGHAGNPGNERADALANKGVDKALGRL